MHVVILGRIEWRVESGCIFDDSKSPRPVDTAIRRCIPTDAGLAALRSATVWTLALCKGLGFNREAHQRRASKKRYSAAKHEGFWDGNSKSRRKLVGFMAIFIARYLRSEHAGARLEEMVQRVFYSRKLNEENK